MLPWLGQVLAPYFGPFRLLTSHGVLLVIGLYAGFFATFFLLPKCFRFLPHDRGKTISVQGSAAQGKPTGAGFVFILVWAAIALVITPFGAGRTLIVGLVVLSMLTGYLDDRSTREWGEYLKAIMDLVLAASAALVICGGSNYHLWLPFTNLVLNVHPIVFVPLATLLIWVSVNATNCSDGVDGLSGTLVMVALISMGAILYFVLGNAQIAKYLLLPHYPDGARWAIMVFTLVGGLAAYLWYNAYPSKVLMGDAGSRPLGFFIGVLVLESGNPFILFIVSSVLLVNGGTGLVKVALLRFMKISILHKTRFPLHDHVRQNRQWSNPQVLLKFLIIQLLVTIGMFGIFLKIR